MHSVVCLQATRCSAAACHLCPAPGRPFAMECGPAEEGHRHGPCPARPLQVQDVVQLILDTQPKGGAAAGGLSREEEVDAICEDLLSKIPALFKGTGGGCGRAIGRQAMTAAPGTVVLLCNNARIAQQLYSTHVQARRPRSV